MSSWLDYGTASRRGGMLVGLNGVAQSGKDTVGKILCDNHGFERLAFADALRQGLYDINPIVDIDIETQKQGFWEWVSGEPQRMHSNIIRLQDIVDELGWDEAKLTYREVRELMQRYGTEGGRDVHGDYCWADIVRKTIEANPSKNYVITDMRFDNEVELIGKLGGIRVQIQREGVTSVNGHVSDRVLSADMFDVIIDNSSTIEALKAKVNQFVIDFNPLIGVAGTQTFGKFTESPLTKTAN